MADGIISYFTLFSIHFIGWVVCQLTIVQFYTPDFLTIWGTETPNGSLWTISVEYQFYLILPLIVWLSNLADKRKGVLGIIGIFLISVLFSYWNFQLNHESLLSKLIHVSVFPYLPFFLNGILGFLFWPYIKRFLINKALFWVIFYLFYSYLGYNILHLYTIDYYPNIFGWIGYLILSMLVLSVAFTRVNLSYKLLRGNDISYGLYIYHMVVINYLIYNGIQKHQFLLTFMITFILAILSWKFVERPSLKLKKSTIGVNI
jgi:peptidoglycan/LPS O-acetylase OafA/YrhL